jgi:toxin ParE1/3/4
MAGNPPTVVRRPEAVRDVIEAADFIARRKSLAAADRFMAAVELTAERLARMPGAGSPWESGHPRLGDLRFAPVSRHRNHLIFDRPTADGIELVRVLHGARDLERILDPDPDDG